MPVAVRKRDPGRNRLAEAIAAHRGALERIAALEAAQPKAQQQKWDALAAVSQAEAALRTAREAEPHRLVSVLVSGGGPSGAPLADAEEALAAARDVYSAAAQAEDALAAELELAEREATRRRGDVNAALAVVVEGSAELAALYAQLEAAWATVRGARKAFDAIQRRLGGQYSQAFTRWERVPPLNWEALGFPLDATIAQRWASALDQLVDDADAPLP